MKTVKLKFVNEGNVVTVYQWETILLFLGFWTPVSSHASSSSDYCNDWIDKVDILAKYDRGEKLGRENFWS